MIIESPNVIGTSSSTVSTAGSWLPLATPDTRAAALDAVADIARAAPSHVIRNDDGTLDLSFGSGAAGVALFLHYAARALDDPDAHAACIDLLGQALGGLHVMPRTGLFGGYAGVAWAVSHLQQRGVEELDDIDLAVIDTTIEKVLGQVPWPDDYDLVSGLVGPGVYGLERMYQGAGEGIVAAVVNRLAEMVEWMGNGLVAWFHPPWLVPSSYRDSFPEGWYNLGVAHGVPGVLAFLARAAHNEVRRETATRMLTAGARWTCTQVRVEAPDDVRLGYRVDPKAPRAPSAASRDAWCYGAPGAAIALLAAARVLGEEPIATCALSLARTAARHDPAEAGTIDASLCHGTAGLAHLYARLYAATEEAAFADAARRWMAHTLAWRAPGEGVGGFSYRFSKDGQPIWVQGSNFLEGAAGIGLVLLAMCSPEPPSWDRVVLVDPLVPLHHPAR